VRNKKLGGMMFWELSDDKTEEGLLQTMRKKLY
jgi:GH18 family chitinase